MQRAPSNFFGSYKKEQVRKIHIFRALPFYRTRKIPIDEGFPGGIPKGNLGARYADHPTRATPVLAHHITFSPNCTWRWSCTAVVTSPKPALPKPVFGLLKCGVLVKLNDSIRSSTAKRSVTGNLRNSEKSRFTKPGPASTLRPRLPNVAGAGAENFVTSKYFSPLPTRAKISGCPARFGRLLLPGAFNVVALKVKFNGSPVCAVKMPLHCQSPSSQRPAPAFNHRPRGPKGNSQM